MTVVDVGPIDLVGPTFDRDLDVLEHVGVCLPEEQSTLLYDRWGGHHTYGAAGHAMTPWPLRDPRNGQKMIALDQQTGLYRHILIPAVVELDHVCWREVADDQAHRFPSLAGRVVLPSIWGRTAGEPSLGDPQVFRLWDLWPLHLGDETELFYALMTALQQPPYFHLCQMARVMMGMDEPCEIVPDDYGRHHHEYNDVGYDFRCVTAEDLVGEWEGLYYVEHPAGAQVTKAFDPLVGLKWPLNQCWDRLQQSSSRNTKRALESYPPDQRAAVIETERTYSPWLLS